MNPLVIPMIVLMILTLITAVAVGILRFRAVAMKQVTGQYYALFRGDEEPDYLVKIGRHFQNLFEIPILFYVLTLVYLYLNIPSAAALVIAWLFVAVRVAHAWVHIWPNYLLLRAFLFALGVTLILVYAVLLVTMRL